MIYGDTTAKRVVLLESPMSMFRHIHQIPIVCTLGSNITEYQFRHLERFEEIIVCNENDKAGWKMNRLVSKRLERKSRISIWQNPFTKKWDAADLDDETFMDLVDDAVPASIWDPNKRLIEYKPK